MNESSTPTPEVKDQKSPAKDKPQDKPQDKPPVKAKAKAKAKGSKPTSKAKAKGSKPASKAKAGKALTLEQAQQEAQSQMQSHSASMGQIIGFMSQKKNLGETFSPSQIATGIGEGITDRDVRKALQKQGLAGSEGKAGVIQAGDYFLYLRKSGNRNAYQLVPEGTAPRS